MSRKNVISSLGVVSTVRDGTSHLWEVKGTDVSIVRVVESSAADEIGRRRDGVKDRAEVRGLRRLEPEDEEEARRDRAISDRWIVFRLCGMGAETGERRVCGTDHWGGGVW